MPETCTTAGRGKGSTEELEIMDQVARTALRNFLTIEDTGTKNPVTIARENLGAVYAT